MTRRLTTAPAVLAVCAATAAAQQHPAGEGRAKSRRAAPTKL